MDGVGTVAVSLTHEQALVARSSPLARSRMSSRWAANCCACALIVHCGISLVDLLVRWWWIGFAAGGSGSVEVAWGDLPGCALAHLAGELPVGRLMRRWVP